METKEKNTEQTEEEIKSEGFDYTKWQREYFDRMKPGEFSAEALAYAKAHPHKGNGKRL